jgi:hypothetical protein
MKNSLIVKSLLQKIGEFSEIECKNSIYNQDSKGFIWINNSDGISSAELQAFQFCFAFKATANLNIDSKLIYEKSIVVLESDLLISVPYCHKGDFVIAFMNPNNILDFFKNLIHGG